MAERIVTHRVYDNVFTDLFSDPENCLKLCRELHPNEEIHPEDVKARVL